ncbi:MAG: alpha/beta fold hydrolase [Microbacteriaceae bacterium]
MLLPIRFWGSPDNRRALLVHGVNGDGATWRPLAERLASSGWHVAAVDLRGHGEAGPGDELTLASYASDLPGSGWDLVVGHSLGGAASVLASLTPGFTNSLVLLDPVFEIDPAARTSIVDEQIAELTMTAQDLARERPHWSTVDVALKVAAAGRSSTRTARESFAQNPDWNVVDSVIALRVRTLIVSGDPAVYSMLSPATAEVVSRANPLVEYCVIAGAGHSPHRDRFEATVQAILSFTSAGAPRP